LQILGGVLLGWGDERMMFLAGLWLEVVGGWW